MSKQQPSSFPPNSGYPGFYAPAAPHPRPDLRMEAKPVASVALSTNAPSFVPTSIRVKPSEHSPARAPPAHSYPPQANGHAFAPMNAEIPTVGVGQSQFFSGHYPPVASFPNSAAPAIRNVLPSYQQYPPGFVPPQTMMQYPAPGPPAHFISDHTVYSQNLRSFSENGGPLINGHY